MHGDFIKYRKIESAFRIINGWEGNPPVLPARWRYQMKRIVISTLLCLLLSIQAFSQTRNATVSGTVQDATGAVLPGVMITATDTATQVVTTVITNEAGVYTLA